MRHIEMHLIETPKDFASANNVGLDIQHNEKCRVCTDYVADADGKFVPFVILLDDESEWIVCKECATSVLS